MGSLGAVRLLSAARTWLAANVRLLIAIVLAAAIGAGAAYLIARDDSPDAETGSVSPAPRVIAHEVPVVEEAADLGFPAFATKNTTRVSGADPASDAAAVALAVHPSTGSVHGPSAVTLVDASDWQGGIAAASLAAAPVRAPILVTSGGTVPDLTASALRALDPGGSANTAGRQIFAVGDAAKPDGFDSLELKGSDPAELAAEIDRLRERLAGKPDHVLLVSSDEPALAMPAAGWAARSGDPVLFVDRDGVPDATREALKRYDNVPAYVLGPESAVSAEAMKEIAKLVFSVERVGDEDPVANAIKFARFASGSFGWNINDPGHGFVIANTHRTLDAAAAAPLSGSGTWGPLLVTDKSDSVPDALNAYLLDLKPGYAGDPTRAVYNHVWVIGDDSAFSVDFQAQVDELAEVAPVTSGAGAASLGPPPGTPESQPAPDNQK